GQEKGPFSVGEKGAGRVRLFWNDHVSYDKISVSTTPYDVSITVPPSGATSVRAAIWWPENLVINASGSVANTHNNIDLQLLDSPEHTLATSQTVPGVFERIELPSLAAGTYILRILPTTMHSTAQAVY